MNGDLPPLPSGLVPKPIDQPAAAPAASAAPALPPLPSGLQPKPLPPGMKLSIHAGPVALSMGPQETTGMETTQQKLGDQRNRLIQLGEEMHDLYQKRLQPKLSQKQISSTTQGLDYAEPGPMRSVFGSQVDPDVEDWIVKSGQFSQALNSYYAASGGGRGGVGYFGEVTAPHVPHPPQGIREILGVWSPTGQQWDLQKQGEQLPILLHNLRRDQGLEGKQTYKQWAPEEEELIKKYGGQP